LDDDPAIRQLVADYLVQNERHVTTVASGKELTAVIASETIDLVVLDVRLQGEEGMQIARKLASNPA
jgi:DNA-binding response OmpR family regulator